MLGGLADYNSLRDLLAAGKWKEADQETKRVMFECVKKSFDNFPSDDLRIIDQLWVKYSNGRFGFSVQKRIYQSLCGTRQDKWNTRKMLELFGDKVGWRKYWLFLRQWLPYSDITFDISAPEGHLPRAVADVTLPHDDQYTTNGSHCSWLSVLSRQDL